MPTDTCSTMPLFRCQDPPGAARITLHFEDRALNVPAGTTVAAALLCHGVGPFRSTPVSAAPRAPYCMMGVCFECLVEIDGIPSRQACLTAARDGMVVRRQQGASVPVAIEEGADHER